MSDVVLQLLVVLILVLIEAFFVAAEIALVTLRHSRVEQLVDEGHRGARRIKRLVQDPARFLAVAQIGVTFVGFLASAFAAVNLADRLAVALKDVPVLKDAAGGVALLIVTILLSGFFIVFGELVPKTMALAHPDRVALALGGPLDLVGRILGPLVDLLTWLTRKIAGGFGVGAGRQAQINTEELKLIVERGGETGVLEAEEEQMISAVIELGERRVHEVMVPRTDMTALPVTAGMDEAIDTFIREGHSRIPVYRQTIDEIVGVLYAKDLLPFLKGGGQKPDLRKLLRAPIFVPESMSIDDLLHKLQGRKVHLAIVLDEYGGTAGMVTIEDLLEEIVGDIQDEYDLEEPLTVRLSEDKARIDGRASVDDLAELFDLDLSGLEDAEEYDTVGGLIYHRIGGVPRPGDEVELSDQNLTLTVEVTDGHRVGKVLAVRRGAGERAGEEGRTDAESIPRADH
ncbi:MAG: hemolysin family protein [Candidatus Limnocylindrales bacterium]|jgi:putative hemolysin